MNLRDVARASGMLGGACWIARMLLDRADIGTGIAGALYWMGLVLVLVALYGVGTTFVSKSELWLQVIVGIAFPLLVWSVVEVVHSAGDPAVIDAVVGLLVAGAVLLAFGQSDSDRKPPRRAAGAHAR